jgi:Flp pilus assembly protein TadG
MIPPIARIAAHWKRLGQKWRASIQDRRGNFAVTFALTAPILILLVGMGVDFLTGLSFKSRWDSAADAAALAANQVATAYANANASTDPNFIVDAIAAGEAAGKKAFNANAGVSETTGSVTPTVVTTNSKTTFTTTVTYTGTTPSNFGSLVGIKTLSVGGSATATQSATTYVNYYLLIDISQSMGIGATQTDMNNLYNITLSMGYSDDGEPGCVFGCHVTTHYALTDEQVAHENGITLRIDSAKSAIQNIISQAQAQATSGNIQFALYAMQDYPTSNNTATVQVAPMSSNYASLTAAAQTLDLGANNATGIGDTDLQTTLTNFGANVLPTQGTGWSAQSPLNYVMIVTDGVNDTPGAGCMDGHCTSVFSSTPCAAIKQNATVGVIYTTYLPIYQGNDPANGYEFNYQNLVLPFQSQIAPSLQSCASGSSNYFEADDGPALISAMSSLFQSSLATLRLSM